MQTLHLLHTLLSAYGWHSPGGTGSPAPTFSCPTTVTPTCPPMSPDPAAVRPGSGGRGGVGLVGLFIAVLAGAAAGAGALWFALRAHVDGAGMAAPRQRTPAADAAAPWQAGGRDRAWNGTPDGGDRDVLVRGMIDLADRLRDSERVGLWKAANRHLEAAGVTMHVADGEDFDPEVHQAGGYQATGLPQSHLTVATTEETGYTDRGKVIRRPKVIVYRAR